MKKRTLFVCESAVVASLYVMLTLLSPNPIGVFQIRLSESLTVLPLFMPSAVWGVTAGCLISNILSGAVVWDAVFGTLATLLAAVLTRYLGKNFFLGALFPVLINALVMPPVLVYCYGVPQGYFIVLLSLLLGQAVSCYAVGYPVYRISKRLYKNPLSK